MKKGIYSQIETHLRDRIGRGQWPVGSRLPSRRELAKEYGVSLITLERAVTSLITDGLLRADDRRGTYIASSGATTSPATISDTSAHFPLRDVASVFAAEAPTRSGTDLSVGIIASLYVGDKDHLELNNFWVRLLVDSVEQALSREGIVTRFFNRVSGSASNRVLIPIAERLQDALAEQVSAIVVIGIDVAPDVLDKSLAVLEGNSTPVVCVTTGELRRPAAHVFYDHHSAGYQAAEHLLQAGRRDLLFFAPFTAFWVDERCRGVQSAVEHARDFVKTFDHVAPAVRMLPPSSGPWVNEEDPTLIGYAAARQAIESGSVFLPGQPGPGVICANDGVAFGFLQAAKEAGKIVGVDFALISFDDHPAARVAGLTSLRPPMEAMGQEAARLLHRALKEGRQASIQVRLRWHLLPRASTRIVAGSPFWRHEPSHVSSQMFAASASVGVATNG